MTLSTPKAKPARDLMLALAVAGGALLLQWVLTLWIRWPVPFIVIEPAIIFTAAMLGRLPATLVMLAGAANAMVMFAPAGEWLPVEPGQRLYIAAYLVISALLIAYGSRLHLRGSRAEQAERRLNLAQDETGVGLFELDYRADTAYASPALCRILGQPVVDGSMPLQQWLGALNAGHVADSRRTLQQKVAAGELRYERELQVERPGGDRRWLLSRVRLDLDASGQLVAARGATLDITARKQLVTELEAAQSQLRRQLDDLNLLHGLSNRLLAIPVLDAALQAVLEAIAMLHETPVGLLRLCEPDGGSRVAAHCGLTAEALAQLSAAGDALHPLSICGQVALTRQRLVIEDVEQDPRSEALRPLMRTLGLRSAHATPLIAGNGGRLLGVLTVLMRAPGSPGERRMRLTDLCAGQAAALIEREQALTLAQEAQRRFEVALQSSPVAFTILAPVHDETGRVVDFSWTYANAAAAVLIDRSVKDLVGCRVLDVLPHAWDEPGFLARYIQVSTQGCTVEFDTLTRHPIHPRWLHVIASPLNDSVVVWFADVTKRREEQQALLDADRRKDDFLATLAHELRNPLAPIRLAAGIVRNPASAQKQRQWSLAVIERQVKHMALLLDDLLDVSRITRGTLPLRRVRSPLQPIIDMAIETSQPLFVARNHDLLLNLPGEPLWLDADPLRIAQVVGNLLVNAAKYTPPGGKVVLSAGTEGQDLVIAVTDNGVGLRAEDCERVFKMFTQVPAADGQLQGGLGIGLALARNLVQMHGGLLLAHSAGLGSGCTFTVRLPMGAAGWTAAEPSAEAGATSPIKPPAITRRRILVADDNRDAADSLASLLGVQGHDVQVAYDGREALSRYHSFQPQVVLLDMAMPEHSGAEVAALIRRQQGDAEITLVAITGFGQQRDRELTLAAGFDHHLVKPIQAEQLQLLIEGAGRTTP